MATKLKSSPAELRKTIAGIARKMAEISNTDLKR